MVGTKVWKPPEHIQIRNLKFVQQDFTREKSYVNNDPLLSTGTEQTISCFFRTINCVHLELLINPILQFIRISSEVLEPKQATCLN